MGPGHTGMQTDIHKGSHRNRQNQTHWPTYRQRDSVAGITTGIHAYTHTNIHTYIIRQGGTQTTHIHTLIHTGIHTYRQAYIHTHIHACIHTYVQITHTYCSIHPHMTHIYRHTHMHTHIHTDNNAYMHTHIYTNTYMRMHCAIHTDMHTRTHTHIHTIINPYIHTDTYTCTHRHTHTCIHAYNLEYRERQSDRQAGMQAATQTNIAAYVHTYIHTRTHTYIHPHMIHTAVYTYMQAIPAMPGPTILYHIRQASMHTLKACGHPPTPIMPVRVMPPCWCLHVLADSLLPAFCCCHVVTCISHVDIWDAVTC